MTNRSLQVDPVLTVLAATTPRLVALTTGLASEVLCTRPTPDEWSPSEVLAHLRACADVWGSCIRTILAEDTPTLRAVSPRTWIQKTDYPRLDFRLSLDAFAAQRADLLDVLSPLPPEVWQRAATVTGAGRVLRLTVLSYADRLARHERAHVGQVERILIV